MMIIGYQGIPGSNSEEAAKRLSEKLGFSDVEYIGLISSRQVIGALKRGEIDFGVVAIKNTLGGTVAETFEAIKNEYLELVATEVLQIHHCVFKKRGIDISAITEISSHIQALNQTKNNVAKHFNNLNMTEYTDTALAAKHLSEGILPENTAVICRKNAGEMYKNLEMIYENIEDDDNNFTEFRMFKMSDIDYSNSNQPSLIEKLRYQLVNETGLGYLSKALMIVAILVSFYLSKWLSWDAWETAVFVGGYLSIFFLFITSEKLRQQFKFKSIVGYWKYYSLSDTATAEEEQRQKFDTPRIVKIEVIDDQLSFNGFMCDKENIPLFESTKVLMSSMGKCRGQLVYWYSNPREMDRGYSINGLVELNWTSKYPQNKINKMSGYYMGKATKDSGAIEYLRITEKEYKAHKNNEFI